MSSEKSSEPESKLGLRGQFALREKLEKIAEAYDLHVTRVGSNRYAIQSASGTLDLDALCPSFVHHDNGVMNNANMKRLLDFLHQPVRTTLAYHAQQEKAENKEGKHTSKEDIQTGRETLHRVLRFAATDSVMVHSHDHHHHHDHDHDHHDHGHHHDAHLDGDICACHAETEAAMRDADAWRSDLEFANPEESAVSVPASGFDPERGFALSLNENILSPDNFDGPHQRSLARYVVESIEDATGESIGQNSEHEHHHVHEHHDHDHHDHHDHGHDHHHDCGHDHHSPKHQVHLTGQELEELVLGTRQPELGQLLERVEFEEMVHDAFDRLGTRQESLKKTGAFTRLTAHIQRDESEKLRQLMQATSALAPVMSSGYMQDMWTRYHFSERYETPLEGLNREYAIFLAVMEQYAEKDNLSTLELEALAQEFYPLMAFSEKVMATLEDASEQAKTGKNDFYSQGREAFQNASIAGVSLSEKQLEEDHQEILTVFQKSLSQGGGAASQATEATVDAAVDFTMDVVNFIRESPKVAATFVGLATTLYIMNNGGDAETAQQAANDMVMLFGETGLEEAAIDYESLPEEAREVQNWHWDMGPLGLYKHYMYDNAVVGPAQTMLDWFRVGVHWSYETVGLPIDGDSAFSKAAERVVEPLANQLFNVNLFQNASHAAFWMYMTSKGFRHGLRGAQKVFDLLSPLTNLGYQSGLSTIEHLRLKQKTSLSERLAFIGETMQSHADSDKLATYTGNRTAPTQSEDMRMALITPTICHKDGGTLTATKSCVLLALAQAAEKRATLGESNGEQDSNVNPTDAPVIQIDSLREEFRLEAQTLARTMKAIDRFDLLMIQSASKIGTDEPWLRTFLRDTIDEARAALVEYNLTGDSRKLLKTIDRHLENIMAVEMKVSDTSNTYETLFGESPKEEQEATLKRLAGKRFGRLKRAHTRQELREELATAKTESGLSKQLKTRALLAANHLWNGMVEGARATANLTRSVANKPTILAVTGVTAAAIGLDMAGNDHAAVDTLAGAAGTAISSAVTSLTFFVYNFWEDVLGVHVGSGAVLLGAGAAAGYAYRHGFKPSAGATMETLKHKLGIDVETAWNNFADRVETAQEAMTERLSQWDMALGRLSGRSKKPETSADRGDTHESGKESDHHSIHDSWCDGCPLDRQQPHSPQQECS